MSEPLPEPLTAELLRAMAASAGVELPPDRAAAFVAQAEPHFALLRALAPAANPTTEPAATFRLDDWPSDSDV